MSEQGDRAMANLTAKLLGQPEPFPRRPAPAPLRAVTAENAHEFSPAPRKRGRPRRIDARDNVVPIGLRNRDHPPTDRVSQWMREMASVAQAHRQAARAARGVPPTPNEPRKTK